MENNPLRGLFGVCSPRLEPQLVTPQPTAPTEYIEYHYKKYVNLWPFVSDPRRTGHKSTAIWDQLVKTCSGGNKP